MLLAVLAAFWCCGTDFEEPDRTGDPAAQRMLDAVTTGDFPLARPDAVVPARWASVMGYLPEVIAGPRGTPVLAKPTGDCSSFTGKTSYDFSATCMEHDLAYDVLRYAGRIGAALPAAARRQADDMFDRDLHARCTQLGVTGGDALMCHTYATGFTVAVELNSWRQGYRPPEAESPWRWIAMVSLTALLLLLPRTWRRARGRRPQDDPFGIAVSRAVVPAPRPARPEVSPAPTA